MKLTDDQLARVRMSGHIPYGLLDHIDSLTVENERLKGERKMTDEELSDMRQWNIDCGATTWSIKFGKLLDHIDSLTERLKEAMRAAPDCKIHPGELTLKCRVCVGEDTATVTDVWREELRVANAERDDLLGLLREMPKRSDGDAAGILWVVKRNRAISKYSDVSEEP